MITAIDMRNTEGCGVVGISFEGFDVAVNVSGTTGALIKDVHVVGRTAIKGVGARNLSLTGVTHNFYPIQTSLAYAVRRAIYGYDRA